MVGDSPADVVVANYNAAVSKCSVTRLSCRICILTGELVMISSAVSKSLC